MLTKKEQRLRRARQTRIRIATQGVARLTVNRTNLHIYASVISGDGGKVLAAASTAELEVRKALGWSSQDMAAQHLDNSGKTMWNIENGKTLPSTEMLYKLSSFGVSIEYILHGVGEMQRHTPVATLRDDEKAFLDIYNRVDDAVKLLLKVLLVQKFPK